MSPSGDRSRLTVLVIDDTPDTLGFLTDALEASGYTALVATGGLSALALVERIIPDLILLDAMMPGLDGFETCRRLKTGPAARTPVIFMTALSETEHIVRGLDAGGVDYVTKPIRLDELLARLRSHLATAQAARSAEAAAEASGGALLTLDPDGQILWSTPAARLLLGHDVQRVTISPAVLLQDARADLTFPHGPLTLTLRLVGGVGPGEWLCRLAQHDSRKAEDVLVERFGLTAREADVLLWIARGKSNRDIGDILALSPRTVNKHLETVFTKLGVENRASAAVLASRTLGEL